MTETESSPKVAASVDVKVTEEITKPVVAEVIAPVQEEPKVVVPLVEEKMPSLETAPFDPRFPNTNQTRYCYSSYLDFYRCQKVKGESYKPCQYFKKVYNSVCPNSWVEKWNDQREDGTFPAKI